MLGGGVSASVSPEPLKDGDHEQIILAPSLAGLPSAPRLKNSNEGRVEISGGPMMGAGSGCQPERDPRLPQLALGASGWANSHSMGLSSGSHEEGLSGAAD